VLLQSLSDQLTALQNLVAVDPPAPTEDADAEPSAVGEAIGELQDALGATIAAYGQLGGAWGQLAAAFDIPQEKHGLNLPVDVGAVALDMVRHKLVTGG